MDHVGVDPRRVEIHGAARRGEHGPQRLRAGVIRRVLREPAHLEVFGVLVLIRERAHLHVD